MSSDIALIIGLLVGAGLVLLVVILRKPATRELARALSEQAEAQRLQDAQALLDRVRASFTELSQEALGRSSDQFLKLAETRLGTQTKEAETTLDAKKKLIDETVKQIATRLGELDTALRTLEKDRRESHGALVQRLESASRTTTDLQRTTAQLRDALAHPQRRGQWGERMAEDVLRLAGLIAGVNYEQQATTEAGRRPDFTFFLPSERCVHMDVKFPLPNYLLYLDAADDAARDAARAAFLRDVRQRIREVTTREYIDPARGTVDYVLVFIPNEQVYTFIHEHDPGLLDEALERKVVLCSPLTLYAYLVVIRQAAEHFRLEQASREILALLAEFRKEWQKYGDVMERMGRSLTQALEQYEQLANTRTRKLDRQLDRIDALTTERQLTLPDEAGSSAPPGD